MRCNGVLGNVCFRPSSVVRPNGELRNLLFMFAVNNILYLQDVCAAHNKFRRMADQMLRSVVRVPT